MKQKLNWRHRQLSEGDPVIVKDCGCKVWCYDGTVVRHCEKHKREAAKQQLASWNKSFEEILEVKK